MLDIDLNHEHGGCPHVEKFEVTGELGEGGSLRTFVCMQPVEIFGTILSNTISTSEPVHRVLELQSGERDLGTFSNAQKDWLR